MSVQLAEKIKRFKKLYGKDAYTAICVEMNYKNMMCLYASLSGWRRGKVNAQENTVIRMEATILKLCKEKGIEWKSERQISSEIPMPQKAETNPEAKKILDDIFGRQQDAPPPRHSRYSTHKHRKGYGHSGNNEQRDYRLVAERKVTQSAFATTCLY